MITRLLLILVFPIAVFFCTNAVWSADFCVQPNGSGETSLQGALDAAENNGQSDTIKVVQGVYVGNFSYESSEGHSITLEGGWNTGCSTREVNPENTILDGNNSQSVLTISANNNGGNIEVDGITAKNGNTSDSSGGGIHAISFTSTGTAGNILLTNNIIIENQAPSYSGGGVYAASYATTTGLAGTVTLINNIISGNDAATGNGGGASIVSLANDFAGETITLLNNTITDNSTGVNGGGVYIETDYNSTNIYNNIIWGNTAGSEGDDIYLTFSGESTYINGLYNDYSDMYGTWSGESGYNIDQNPRLSGNYHLRSSSPCIDTGTNTAFFLSSTDIDGDARIIDGNRDGTATVDMGADEYVPKGVLSFFLLLFD